MRNLRRRGAPVATLETETKFDPGIPPCRKIVVVTSPDPDSLRKSLRAISGNSFSWAYLGQGIIEMSQVRAELGDQSTYVDSAGQFHDSNEALRDAYLSEVYHAGRDLGSLRWWISSVSYRNGIFSKSFHQLCLLKTGLDLIAAQQAESPLILVAQGPVRDALKHNLRNRRDLQLKAFSPFRLTWLRFSADAVKMLLHRIFFVARECHRVFQSRRLLPDIPRTEGPTTVIMSWATKTNIHLGPEFHRSFFGHLADGLRNLGLSVAIAPVIVRPLGFKEALKSLSGSDQLFFIPHRYISYLDVLRTALVTMSRPPRPSFAKSFCGMDIRPIVNEDLRVNWISNSAADVLLTPILIRRWKSLGFQITRFIHIYENQPSERALCWQARQSYPEASIVGYQHARVPRQLLNFNLAPGGEAKAPLPDRIVTVGNLTARVLCKNGYPSDRVRVGGALQLQSLTEQKPSNTDPMADDQLIVLVAPGDSIEEAVELVYMAANLFGDDRGIQVVLKCHPEMPFQRVKGLIGRDLPDNVLVSDEPILELLSRTSAMVYSSTTVAVQALALGVPVVHVASRFGIDMDPLETVPDLRLEATGLEQLREQVLWLLEHREYYISERKQEWSRLVKDMYGPVTQETIHAFVD